MHINRALFSEIVKIQQINSASKTHLEIERRFLVKSLPKNLNNYQHENIIQGYLETKDGTSVRLRKLGDKYYQTTKIGTGKVRTETEIEISKKLFDALWHLTKRRRIEKTRYEIPHEAGIIQLDIYHKELKGLTTVEIEFDTIQACNNLNPPNWFGEEVTDNPRFTNKSLAIHGLPKEHKI